MDAHVRVAVVRSDNRRGAVAEALGLIADDLRLAVRASVLIKPNLVSHRRQLPSTHADTLSATVDAVIGMGARAVMVAEGASDARAGFERFGYRRECWDRPVRFLDFNRDETEWEAIELEGVDGSTRRARVSRTAIESPCRVSLALAKTHVTSIATFSLKNMLSTIHPQDRVMMHGHAPGGNGYSGWKRRAVEFLKGDSLLVNRLTRLMGWARRAKHWAQGKGADDGWRRLSEADRAFLRSVEAMNRNLVALSRVVRPHVGVVDGFVAMHREGPRHGTPIRLGTVVAGTDAVAVDAVAAAMMGFDPMAIGYLRLAHAAGLGVADLARIEVVGDPIATVRRRCVPHSNYAIQRFAGRSSGSVAPGPHLLIRRDEGAHAR
jgi:uncharacterized protein (DUF362 family)